MEKVIDRLVGKLDKVLKEDRKNNPNESYLRGAFFFGRHSVRYSFRESGLVVEIYNPELNLYLDNVANHCERCAVRWDDVEIEKTDIWNEHGFASSSDYVQYRFG